MGTSEVSGNLNAVLLKFSVTNLNKVKIDNHVIGQGSPTFLIAELGQAHDGSLGLAHSYIDAVSDAGADAIKFQTHFAREESTIEDIFRVEFSRQDQTRYDYWKRMEFTQNQWAGLADHATKRNIVFLSSPFSIKSLKVLKDIGIRAIKLASGEISHQQLLAEILDSNLPIIFSTGMSNWNEINKTVELFELHQLPIVLMQCTSKYPTCLNDVGLNVVEEMRARFPHPVGLSDHSGTIYPGTIGIARRIAALEVHVTFDKKMFGPDTASSITLEELSILSDYREAVSVLDDNPVDKDRMASDLAELRSMFSRSLALVDFRPKHHRIVASDLAEKKPGFGIPVEQITDVVGKRLRSDTPPNKLLGWEDLIDG